MTTNYKHCKNLYRLQNKTNLKYCFCCYSEIFKQKFRDRLNLQKKTVCFQYLIFNIKITLVFTYSSGSIEDHRNLQVTHNHWTFCLEPKHWNSAAGNGAAKHGTKKFSALREWNEYVFIFWKIFISSSSNSITWTLMKAINIFFYIEKNKKYYNKFLFIMYVYL